MKELRDKDRGCCQLRNNMPQVSVTTLFVRQLDSLSDTFHGA